MDTDASDNRQMTTGLKFDSQPNDVSSTTLELSTNDEKSEPSESNNGKTTSKSSNVTDLNSQKLPVNDTSTSVINRIPKSEFRDDASSAISDTNNDMGDMSTRESETADVEIKQEEPYHSSNPQLSPHATSKIQVCNLNSFIQSILWPFFY